MPLFGHPRDQMGGEKETPIGKMLPNVTLTTHVKHLLLAATSPFLPASGCHLCVNRPRSTSLQRQRTKIMETLIVFSGAETHARVSFAKVYCVPVKILSKKLYNTFAIYFLVPEGMQGNYKTLSPGPPSWERKTHNRAQSFGIFPDVSTQFRGFHALDDSPSRNSVVLRDHNTYLKTSHINFQELFSARPNQ